jgi:hypothetical protein
VRRGPWLRDTTGHGLLIVAVLCLCLLLGVLTACTLALRGEPLPDRFDALLTGLLVLVPTLLARARRDVPLDATAAPVPVEVTGEPLAVTVDERLDR